MCVDFDVLSASICGFIARSGSELDTIWTTLKKEAMNADFLSLVGAHSQDGCVEAGTGGWHFDYRRRDSEAPRY